MVVRDPHVLERDISEKRIAPRLAWLQGVGVEKGNLPKARLGWGLGAQGGTRRLRFSVFRLAPSFAAPPCSQLLSP